MYKQEKMYYYFFPEVTWRMDKVSSGCHKNQYEASFNTGKLQGIREVVEWIENKARHDSSGNTLQELAVDKQLIIDAPLWQIKLNEWGIKR